MWRALTRLCIGALGATAAVVAMLDWLTAAAIPPPPTTLDIARNMPGRLSEAARAFVPGGMRIVVMGDSTVVAYEQGRTVVDRLDQTLRASSAQRVRVDSLAALGMSAFEYYPLARRIADARPDAAVLAFNLQWLSRRWRDSLARPEMLALLRPRELPQAISEPLYWWNVTFDRLLLYVTLWQVGALEPWHAYRVEQVRTGNGLDALRGAAQRRWEGLPADSKVTGMPPIPLAFAEGRSDRLNAKVLRDLYEPALDGVHADHPPLELFAAILEEFADKRIPILVYLTPVNVEWMRKVGILDEQGLARTVHTLRTVCGAHGAVLLDLHALLPDAGFRDGGGHFATDQPGDGPLLVAQQVAPVIRDLLSSAGASSDAVQ
ncbi:MAG: hypothetical protein IT293_18580 [Deltaproteobacteria bacterium]|nr:hypothetical protein [Deltaproteobacteria bacterium]